MTREEIEDGFVRAGWEMYHSSEYLLAGTSGELAILAAEFKPESEDPLFELCDGAHATTYWARVIPTPRMPAVLAEKHGGGSEEERGKSLKRGAQS
jgi:hypothetical protein